MFGAGAACTPIRYCAFVRISIGINPFVLCDCYVSDWDREMESREWDQDWDRGMDPRDRGTYGSNLNVRLLAWFSYSLEDISHSPLLHSDKILFKLL